MRSALQQYYLGLDRDVAAWVAAVVANGGAVSAPRAAIVGRFIAQEKASGAWALTDDYWGFWAESSAQALTSLKQRRLATAVAAPTFTADRGYAFNGSSQYINTGFIPNTHGVNDTGTQQRLGVYERTNVSTGTSAGVTTVANTNRMWLLNYGGSGALAGFSTTGGANASFTLSPADSRGFKATSRAGGNIVLCYNRGVRLTDVSGMAGNNGVNQTHALYVGALNLAGTASSFRASSPGAVVVGGPLSDAQEAAQYTNLQAWATAVGAQV